MGFIIYVTSSIAGFIARKSRLVAFGILIVLWILFSLNTYNADYANYEFLYHNYQVQYAGSAQTVGYQFLVMLSNSMGLSFLQFRCVIGAFCLGLIYAFVSRYTKHVAFVLALYLLLPFLYDIVQYRQFLANCIAIYCLRFIIEDSKYGIAKFGVGLILAFSIHPSTILYGFFLLAILKDSKVLAITVILALGILFLSFSGLLQPVASIFIDSAKYDAYFSSIGRFGFIPYWVSCALLTVIVRTMPIDSISKLANHGIPSGPKRIDNRVSKLSARSDQFLAFFHKGSLVIVLLMAFLPLSLQNFYRLIRSALLLFYIFFVVVFFERKAMLSKKERSISLLFFIIWFVFTCWLVFSGVWNLVVINELTYNVLWNSGI